jgi:thiol-disulfide isomerase/thioredoxin
MVLDWNTVYRVDWPIGTIPVTDPFIVSLRDGSSIYGDLVSVSGSSVFIHGSRYGDVELKRAEVLNARRLKGGDLILAGPTGYVGCKEMKNPENGAAVNRFLPASANGGKGATAFASGPGGAFQMPYWNRAALLGANLPNSMDVEFHLHASGRPDFRVSLGDDLATDMQIETWDDEIVLAVSNEFKLVRKIADDEHDVALRVCWDCTRRYCSVYSPAGDLITDWQAPAAAGKPLPPSGAFPGERITDIEAPPAPSPKGGLFLQNKGADLSLDFLRIRKWNGSPPPKIDVSQPRVELADGRILEGEVISGSGGSIQLTGSGAAEQSGTSFALTDIDALVFSPDPPEPVPAAATLSFADGTPRRVPPSATLSFADGACIEGQITAIKNGSATLATTFSAQPLVARLDALRQLLIHPPPDSAPPLPLAKLDTLLIRNSTFHGTLVTAGDDSPRWLPAGGAAPVILSRTIPYEIARFFPEDARSPEIPALFYTRAGDVLPGNLHALDGAGVEFDSGITEATKLPAAALQAIQFGASPGGLLRGVTGPEWRILKGDESKVRRSGDSLEMDPGTEIGNAAAMQSSEIRFKVSLEGDMWAVRLRMFCAGANPAKSTNLLFATNGNEINCGIENTDGQFDEPRIQGASPSGTVAVRIAVEERWVGLYLNGLFVGKFPVPPASRAGAGLIIEPAGIWGNTVGAIKLSDFSMLTPPGCTWLPDIAADAKAEALSIPRFLRNDPPVHALIAANGDILRGEIEAATNTSFGFRTGMEELVVPRDRVKAIVWLGKPIDAPPPPAPPAPGQEVLGDQLNQRIRFGFTTLRNITSLLHSLDPKLNFKLPTEGGAAGVGSLTIGGEPVASALDKICAGFGLTYHVDDKGVIVLEPSGPAAAAPAAMVEKVYWLKPGSFPAEDAPDKIAAAIAAKGIPFPPGATAAWHADSARLSVRNTPENQARLAHVLAPEFAGAIGSPTHWLVLTSGARLALAVDKFGKDAITGWNPLYGRCTIPTAEVAVLRTSALDPSAAMKSVGDWQTVFAPEPVLPEAGGDSSAMVGKPAADFKLPLLDGGTFQLAHEKGKIVVLDFWATWCGPCVRSLPGLIQSMSPFPPDRVTFVGIDQDEPASVVKQFLETRGWKMAVALDDGSRVGRQYGADAIPHTVIIGTDGKVAWVKTSYTPGAEGEAAAEVNQLLAPAPAAR